MLSQIILELPLELIAIIQSLRELLRQTREEDYSTSESHLEGTPGMRARNST